jgi:hypothetical protein
MTTDKARKRAVRSRMTKTGESYTAARRRVVGDPPTAATAEPTSTVELAPGAEAAPARPPRPSESEVSDAAIQRATGRTWAEWLQILDERGLEGFSHRETAAWLVAEHRIPGWWAQNVTVGFERARGLRAVNQTMDGFTVSVSKTLDLPVEALYRAIVDEAERERWLPVGTLQLRTATPHKTARFDFGGGPSRVAVGFTPKGPDRATIALQHDHLAGSDDVERMRAFWRTAFADLASRPARRP